MFIRKILSFYFENGVANLSNLWIDILLTLTLFLLFWIYFGTNYELTQTELKYKSGPIRGKIKISEIQEITKGKNLWSGLKPATARSGLIIKYTKYDQLYISPKTNETFIKQILELNSKIKINDGSTLN